MEEVIKNTAVCYYTDLLMFCCCWICLITAMRNRWKFPELRFISIYPLASIVQAVLIYTGIYFNTGKPTDEPSVNVFLLIEFLIIYQLMFKIIKLEKYLRLIRVLYFGFLIYLLYMWIYADSFFGTSSKIFLVQNLFLLVPTLLYFLQIFQITPRIQLSNTPEFWIAIGCLFYFSCTIPLFLLESLKSIYDFYFLSSINYLAYSVLFIFISRAFMCKKVTYDFTDN